MAFYVYILHSESLNRYYVGETKNLKQRLYAHNSGRERYTKRGIPWRLVFSKRFNTRAQAIKVENFLKSQESKKFLRRIIDATYQIPQSVYR